MLGHAPLSGGVGVDGDDAVAEEEGLDPAGAAGPARVVALGHLDEIHVGGAGAFDGRVEVCLYAARISHVTGGDRQLREAGPVGLGGRDLVCGAAPSSA